MNTYWEFRLFLALAVLVAIWLVARLVLLWRDDVQRWKRFGTQEDQGYHLKGYAARPNVKVWRA